MPWRQEKKIKDGVRKIGLQDYNKRHKKEVRSIKIDWFDVIRFAQLIVRLYINGSV